jgi:hypothetical protein
LSDPFLLLVQDRVEEREQRWHAIGGAEAAVYCMSASIA